MALSLRSCIFTTNTTTMTTVTMILPLMMKTPHLRSMTIPCMLTMTMLLPLRTPPRLNKTPHIHPPMSLLLFFMGPHTLRLEKTRFRVLNRERLNLRRQSKRMSFTNLPWRQLGMLNGTFSLFSVRT